MKTKTVKSPNGLVSEQTLYPDGGVRTISALGGETKFSSRYFLECLDSADLDPASSGCQIGEMFFMAEHTLVPLCAHKRLQEKILENLNG